MFDTLEIVTDREVATIWMNRPSVHNAFDARLIDDLDAVLTKLDATDAVRVVILAGRGKHFSAGADIGWMQAASAASPEVNLDEGRRLAGMLRRLATMSKPTLARVQGAALGGGLGLVAACDICVAEDGARFATTEVRLGLAPATIAPYVIRAIGARQAARYFQTAESFSAARAAELGLVHEIAPAGHLDAAVDDVVAALLRGGPRALSVTKALIRTVTERVASSDELVEETARCIATLRVTAEAREGLEAFLAKRSPAWIRKA